MSYTRKSSGAARSFKDQPQFQHWYRDHQVYFITARCAGQHPAFADEAAKQIFWRQFDKYIERFTFQPWVTSLLDNHYHTIGYLQRGSDLAPMLKGIHGSVAKLVNDHLQSESKAGRLQSPRSASPRSHSPPLTNGRLVPFWHDRKGRNYFDGCLRDQKQGRLTYRYVLEQSMRHRICRHWRDYPHTRVSIPLDDAITFALTHHAFLEGVPYRRYHQPPPPQGGET